MVKARSKKKNIPEAYVTGACYLAGRNIRRFGRNFPGNPGFEKFGQSGNAQDRSHLCPRP
ncbi:MAG: hypothetical protein DU430_00575 [Candidatus Tokpelaia sp.]|nr:MAG: hypothetical protein DU430_00575 [Candidatus Tokpelaia sp.]